MTDLGWAADGIEHAIAVGGVPLEVYRRPGFTGDLAVRRAESNEGGAGIYFDAREDEGAHAASTYRPVQLHARGPDAGHR